MEKCVYALGNFDGVHKGHYAVIKSAIDIARELGIKAKALTFEPHPREVLNPSGEPFRLTSFDQKRRLILSIGMDDVVKVDFSAHTANMSAEEFVRSLASTTAHIVAGHDFAFGKGRSGNMSTLAKIAETMEIGVTEVPALLGDGEALSSTKIRDLLKAGLPEQAAWILGRPWRVCGIVIKGAERGRQIGIRTANIELGRFLRPKFGVYAIKAYRAGEDMPISGVANIGVRPTFTGSTENLEAHLFDFNEDIYGQEWEFEFIKFLRPELKFAGLEDLRCQIEADIVAAKRALIPSDQ